MGFPGTYQMGEGRVLKGVVVQRNEFTGRPLIGALSFYRRSTNCSSLLHSYYYNFPTGDPSYSYNPSEDTRRDLSYLNYFGVDWSESSFAPQNPEHLHRQSFGQEFSHGRSSNEDIASYSPGMEVKEITCDTWSLILDVYPCSLIVIPDPWSLSLILNLNSCCSTFSIWDDRSYERSMILTLYTDPWF